MTFERVTVHVGEWVTVERRGGTVHLSVAGRDGGARARLTPTQALALADFLNDAGSDAREAEGQAEAAKPDPAGLAPPEVIAAGECVGATEKPTGPCSECKWFGVEIAGADIATCDHPSSFENGRRQCWGWADVQRSSMDSLKRKAQGAGDRELCGPEGKFWEPQS